MWYSEVKTKKKRERGNFRHVKKFDKFNDASLWASNLADKVGGLDIARDSKHFGPNIHKQFAKDIYEKYCAIQNAQENIK